MNHKILSEPKDMESLVNYWIWKKFDLVRSVVNLQLTYQKTPKEKKSELTDKIMGKMFERNLIDSLLKKHMYGEF